jgi:hypothetical protein
MRRHNKAKKRMEDARMKDFRKHEGRSKRRKKRGGAV